uniref:ZP domain-containing protein n=1 Tax=Heterorhabditis bacteriophora TaxID=37862 RepID=A0A1I7X896_HETBA
MRWLLLLLPTAALATKNVFVSSPFDNFRIECPKKAAATELSIRMVESVGAKRQDVIFDLSCESVDELYPWINIPVGISDIEREDCYYSSMFDPILDDKTDMSCKRREYLAGITRLTDTSKPNKLLNMPFVPLAVDSTEPITKNIFANASRAAIVKIPQFTIAEGTVHTTTNAITPVTTSTPTTFIPKTHIVPTISEQPSMLSEPDETDITLPSIRGGFTRHAPEYNLTQNLEKATVKHSVQPKLNIEIITLPNKTAGLQPSNENQSIVKEGRSMVAREQTTEYGRQPAADCKKRDFDFERHLGERPIHASSESSADEIFKHTVTTLLQKEGVQNKMATLKPLQNIPSVFTPANGPNEIDVATDKLSQNESKINEDNLSTKTTQQPKEVSNTMEDITMVSDLSRITFPNEDFPKADERKSYLSGKPKISKSDLDIWSSEEDDMEALYGLVEFATEDPPTTTRKLTKLRRKVTRAHRLPVTEKTITTVPNINTIEDKETSANNIITTSLVITTSPNNALTIENGHVPEIMVTDRNFSKSFVDQQDNARFVDEETNISPFEDKTEEMNSHMVDVCLRLCKIIYIYI